MDEANYIKERVDDQINWYDRKSAINKRNFKFMRIVELLAAASIPFLSAYVHQSVWMRVAIGALGVVIVVVAGFIALNKWQENWIAYRTTAETLKHQKYLYLTRSSPYSTGNAFKKFVRRVESEISKENSSWGEHMAEDHDEHED